MTRHPSKTKLLSALIVTPIALVASSSSFAQTSPYYVGVSQGFTHDSNVLRTTDERARSDNYSSTGLVAGIDQPLGRQRLYGSGSVRYNKYQDVSQLDNTSYSLSTGVDLATVGNITGAINYSINQALVNYGSAALSETSNRNIEKSQQLFGRASWGVGLLSLDATGSRRTLRYTTRDAGAAPFDQNVGSLGITYRPSAILTTGVAYRISRGEYVNTGAKFDRDDIDLTANWVPTGLSTVSGRLSFGKQTFRFSNVEQSSNARTGSLSWDYKPTGKLAFNLWFSRDTGAESSFLNRTDVISATGPRSVGDNSSLTNTLSLRGNYAATGKISVNASARVEKHEIDQSFTDSSGLVLISGSYNQRVFSLGATYVPIRSVTLGCNLSRESRSASAVTFSYSANVVGCSAQLTLR